MYLAETRLPHVLPPLAYRTQEWFDAEQTQVFRRAWQVVGTTADLAKPGDFITAEIAGTAVQVRRFGDETVAVSNICAHRHCLIEGRPAGNTPTLRCPYHGWEYGADGRTRKIPASRNFVPFDANSERLARYRVETCGGLVFVNLELNGPELPEFLGPVYDLIQSKSGPDWRVFLNRRRDVPVNWKVPVEASLESYHVPAVHPGTFREDPGESRSEHTINGTHTAFETTLPFDAHSRADAFFQRLEGRILRACGFGITGRYAHHHVFPNLLVSHTDTLLLVQSVLPIGPSECRMLSWQFGQVGAGSLRRRVMGAWGRLAAGLTTRVLEEDISIYPRVQQGLNLSHGRGVLGRCEERIYAYQLWLDTQMTDGKAERSASRGTDIAARDSNPEKFVAEIGLASP